jgi:hypothetical protein
MERVIEAEARTPDTGLIVPLLAIADEVIEWTAARLYRCSAVRQLLGR